jgi:hypothetical protein
LATAADHWDQPIQFAYPGTSQHFK